MLQKVDWPYSRSYRSGSEHEPLEFYLTSFANSNSLDLLLGYFSFSAINVLSIGFAQFLANGGKMRVIANNILSKTDKETILRAEEPINEGLIDLEDVRSIRYMLNDYGRHFFECMAWLIKNQRIEIVLVKPKSTMGIAHYKAGVFDDGIDQVMFSGSCNFTAYGMVENLERLDAYLSWENSRSSKKITDLKNDFELLFSKQDETVEYIPVKEVEEAIRDEFGGKELQQLLTTEQELIRMRQDLSKSQRLAKLLRKTEEQLDELASKPRFPYASGPRDYQKDAYQNWVNNGFKGIFAMATGTGKTITSLNCLLNESRKDPEGVYHAIILVPTITLVNQWEHEAKSFNFQEVIKVSSKVDWERGLATTLSTAKRVPTSFIIISTYASFIRDRFNKYMAQLPPDTVFIADEAHNIGSRSVLNRLESLQVEKRIALSATPKRIYDPEGSAAIEAYFNDKEPYTYAFTMERAITEGILCNYDYHPHIVQLTADELEEYAVISKKLSRLYSAKSGGFTDEDLAQMLLMKRKRIIHKATNKLGLTRSILEKRFKQEGNLRYTFIYVPEGVTSEPSEDDNDDEGSSFILVEEQENQSMRLLNLMSVRSPINKFSIGISVMHNAHSDTQRDESPRVVPSFAQVLSIESTGKNHPQSFRSFHKN
ncbi:MAG: DEAD/DEAH box helicase family protein [Flavobacteriales bacterium]|nr:DEAD/DEAH box helicase family protein [Flavobacteriales bacterium]